MIGFIIWLTQPSTQNENETSSSENKESSNNSSSVINEEFEPRKFEKIITTTTTSTQSDGNLKAILTSTSQYKIDTIYESSYEAVTDQDDDKKISFTKSQTFEIRHEPILNRSSTPQPSSLPDHFEQDVVLNDSFIEDEDLRPSNKPSVVHHHFESSSESSDEKTHLPILIQPKSTQLPILIQQKEENNNQSESLKSSSSLTKTLESIKTSSYSGILESSKTTTETSKLTTSREELEQEKMISKIVDDLVCDESEEFAYTRNKQKLYMDEVEAQIRKLEEDAEKLDKHFEQIKDLKVEDYDTVSTKTVMTATSKEKDEDTSSQNSLLGKFY